MRYLSATSIFSGKEYLPSNTVLVLSENNTITDIITNTQVDAGNIEFYDGILCPGFINTHCHLELSHLKNKIQQGTGIVDFGLEVIKQRNCIPEEEQIELMLEVDKLMQNEGIVAVGDISNTSLSISAKSKSKLFYHTFIELIALNPARANSVFNSGQELLNEYKKNNLSASLAPHAPYSASYELIKLITDLCSVSSSPTSIHNQESKAENDFFLTKTGDYLRLYQTLNLAIDFFYATNKSSLLSFIPNINKNTPTLLVHNTFSSMDDIRVAQQSHNHLYWCICSNANLYIEKSLPEITKFTEQNCKLTIGTDSLASNHSLSIINEINTILTHQPNTSLEVILKAATFNGAEFLGIDNIYGSFEIGKQPGVNLITQKDKTYEVKKLR